MGVRQMRARVWTTAVDAVPAAGATSTRPCPIIQATRAPSDAAIKCLVNVRAVVQAMIRQAPRSPLVRRNHCSYRRPRLRLATTPHFLPQRTQRYLHIHSCNSGYRPQEVRPHSGRIAGWATAYPIPLYHARTRRQTHHYLVSRFNQRLARSPWDNPIHSSSRRQIRHNRFTIHPLASVVWRAISGSTVHHIY